MIDLIVNFTPTGMIPTKKMTPHVPVEVSEIVEQVHEACDIGITMVHLHARESGSVVPTYRSEVYRDIIEGVRAFAPDLVICVSLSGRNFPELEKRAEPVTLDGAAKPDMGSLTLSSLNFAQQASLNAPNLVQDLARVMLQHGVVPELEAFDLGMVNYANYLEKKGLVKPPHYANLLFGNIAGAQADLGHLGLMVKDLPEETYWSMAGIGTTQLAMNAVAVASGGGVRVGLEDNIWFDRNRQIPARNSDLIRRIHRLAELHERKIMSPAELRKRLELLPGNGEYGRPTP